MDTVKRRLPGGAFVPPSTSRASREKRMPGLLHDFARLNIHPPSPRATLAESSACASGRFGVNGETGCDVSTGKTVTTIHEPPPCYRHCVERHEAVHARDIAPCCTRANAAYKAAKTDDAKSAVEDKFAKWIKEDNVDWLECRGYTESAKCADEYVKKNCGAKKQEANAGEGVSGLEKNPPVSLTPISAGHPERAQPYGGPDGQEAMHGLAEDKPDSGAGTPAPTDKPDGGAAAPSPEQCCPQLMCYWRVSQGRADNVCGRAPKALTRCPL